MSDSSETFDGEAVLDGQEQEGGGPPRRLIRELLPVLQVLATVLASLGVGLLLAQLAQVAQGPGHGGNTAVVVAVMLCASVGIVVLVLGGILVMREERTSRTTARLTRAATRSLLEALDSSELNPRRRKEASDA